MRLMTDEYDNSSLGILTLPILLAVGVGLAGCNEAETAPRAEVRPVLTLIAEPLPLDEDRRAVGEVRPRHESDLGFRIAGKLVGRSAEVGASVRKGEVLGRLEEQDHRNRLKSAQADIGAAQAVLTEAQAAEDRQRQLLARGVTTRSNYDVAMKNLRSAEAKLEAAKASFGLARDQLAYTELQAEFDGVVTAVGAEAGQFVNAGQMVVRLARPGQKDAVFSIAESTFGDARPAGAPPTVVVVSLLSHPAVTAEGEVREVSPIADPATRTFQVKVTLRDPPEQMRFGASVGGRAKSAAPDVVTLPGSALYERGGQPAVWVVDPASHTVGLKPVSVARYEADRVIVGAGLNKGDIVVTAGVNRLREQQTVRLRDVP